MTTSVNEIVSQIVELSLEKCTGDPVRDIYTVSMDIEMGLCEVMRLTQLQERTEVKDGN